MVDAVAVPAATSVAAPAQAVRVLAPTVRLHRGKELKRFLPGNRKAASPEAGAGGRVSRPVFEVGMGVGGGVGSGGGVGRGDAAGGAAAMGKSAQAGGGGLQQEVCLAWRGAFVLCEASTVCLCVVPTASFTIAVAAACVPVTLSLSCASLAKAKSYTCLVGAFNPPSCPPLYTRPGLSASFLMTSPHLDVSPGLCLRFPSPKDNGWQAKRSTGNQPHPRRPAPESSFDAFVRSGQQVRVAHPKKKNIYIGKFGRKS